MEIIQLNETFTLKDVTDVYEMSGTINKETEGSMHIYFTVNTVKGTYVGNGHYDKYVDNENVNFGVNCSEEVRKELLTYAISVVDSVLENFKNID
jgi:hypothetical protein